VSEQVHVPPRKSGKLLQDGANGQFAKYEKVAYVFMHFTLAQQLLVLG
jgi:hypothetical protein